MFVEKVIAYHTLYALR